MSLKKKHQKISHDLASRQKKIHKKNTKFIQKIAVPFKSYHNGYIKIVKKFLVTKEFYKYFDSNLYL